MHIYTTIDYEDYEDAKADLDNLNLLCSRVKYLANNLGYTYSSSTVEEELKIEAHVLNISIMVDSVTRELDIISLEEEPSPLVTIDFDDPDCHQFVLNSIKDFILEDVSRKLQE